MAASNNDSDASHTKSENPGFSLSAATAIRQVRNSGDLEMFIRREGRVPAWDMVVMHGTFQEGDAELKFKIQWLAASMAGKQLHYYSYLSDFLKNRIEQVKLQFQGKTIGELCSNLKLRKEAVVVRRVRAGTQEGTASVEMKRKPMKGERMGMQMLYFLPVAVAIAIVAAFLVYGK
ncbi:Hypothetical predicted protein [Cloeon dipterum]|uniref:Uncharacterized protein n=1 Tax=Cloeon dipterum TaxID=197152 RepID=A0A8S1DQF5_9INSE|nr:Hypothetical predicted protein [Cloeon dipterum]